MEKQKNLVLPTMQRKWDSLEVKSENNSLKGGRKLNYGVFLTPQQFAKCLQLVCCILVILLAQEDDDSSFIAIVAYSSCMVTGFLIWANLLDIFSNKRNYLFLELYFTVIAAILFGVSATCLFFQPWLSSSPFIRIIGLHAAVVYAAGGFTIWQELRSSSLGTPQRLRQEGDDVNTLEKGEQNLGELCSVRRKLNFESILGPATFPKFVQLGFSWLLSVSTMDYSYLLVVVVVSNISILVTWTLLLCDMLDVRRHFSTKKYYLEMQLILSVVAAPSLMVSSLILILNDFTVNGIFGLQAALAYAIGAFLLLEELKRTTETAATSSSSDNRQIFLNSKELAFTVSKLSSSTSEPRGEEAVVMADAENKAKKLQALIDPPKGQLNF